MKLKRLLFVFGLGLMLVGQTSCVQTMADLRAKAEKGSAKAQTALGDRYAQGRGGRRDPVEAVKWYRKAAEQGVASAQRSLGYSYYKGLGVATNYVEAAKWFRKAAEQNDARAQFSLAYCYRNGLGVAANDVEAVKWYRKAAKQNDAVAQCNLGYCYDKGHGVTKDEVEAVRWYRKAAKQNLPGGLSNLAWTLATSANPAIRDGANAVVFAEKAVAATGRTDPRSLGALAAAYAEVGRFEDAVRTQQAAIALLETEEAKTDYRFQLKRYEAKTPYQAKD